MASIEFPGLPPNTPTNFLPPLTGIRDYSPTQMKSALKNLQEFYWPSALPIPSRTAAFPLRQLPQGLGLPKGSRVKRSVHVPDSGYASEVEEEDEEIDVVLSKNEDDTDTLRADPFERTFSIKWLTGFISRSDTWISFASNQDDEDERYQIMDEITGLLSAFAVYDQTEEALTRNFSFPLANEGKELNVELNDAPIANEDHTSVGLQSWASSILLATRMCAAPVEFGFGPVQCAGGQRRILELGAGTGLLSIVAAKLLCDAHCDTKTEVVATDYHPDVLSNLISNIQTNFPSSTLPPIRVHRLDWQYPLYAAPLDSSFELILAADVVYQPEHAGWIKGCVERLLLRPEPFSGAEGGIFWLIIALRSTGRHEGLSDTVDELFPDPGAFRPRSKEDESSDRVGGGEWKLAVLGREEVSKQDGFGRADESGYKLFKIGWVKG